MDRKGRVTEFFAKLRGQRSSLREKMLRRSGKVLLSLSTIPTRRYLEKSGPLRVMVDNSVLGHSITHETGWISTGPSEWKPADGSPGVTIDSGYAARIPVHSSACDSRTYREIRYLAGIAHLARLGRLQLFTSAELYAERFRQPAGRYSGYGYFDLGMFEDLKFETVDGFHFDTGDAKGAQQKRLKSCNDTLYQSLVSVLGQKSNLDAFHILTSERFNMFCFLHIDFPLAAKMVQHRFKPCISGLQTKVLLPSEFAAKIGLLPLNTNLLSFESSSFPVRADIHWPAERRMRPRKDNN